MRNYNGYGSVSKLSGPRRRPWIVRVTSGWSFDAEGMKVKQIQKVIGYYATRAEAIKALADYNDDPFDVSKIKVTFDQCYQQISKDFKPSRISNYVAAFKYLTPLHNKPIRQIKAPMMQECVDSCQNTLQSDVVSLCHKIFEYAIYNEITDKNPSILLKKQPREDPKERTLFTSEEIRQIETSDEWYMNILACLIYSGMRGKELRTLAPEDIDLDNMVVNIRQGKNKTSVRQIPIHAHAEAYFRRYKTEGINFYGHAYNTFNTECKRAFSVQHHGHDTRHTFTTKMRECGSDPLVLQRILGHAPDTITLKVYTHISMDEMRENINLLKY